MIRRWLVPSIVAATITGVAWSRAIACEECGGNGADVVVEVEPGAHVQVRVRGRSTDEHGSAPTRGAPDGTRSGLQTEQHRIASEAQVKDAATDALRSAKKLAPTDAAETVEVFANDLRARLAGIAGQRAMELFRVPLAIEQDKEALGRLKLFVEEGELGTRIYGGVKVPQAEFPDCVAVGNRRSWFCTGTLVAKNLVVCCAHCEPSGPTRVYFGNDVGEPGKEIAVTSVVRHPGYGGPGGNYANDLMALVLAEDATVAPCAIATTAEMERGGALRLVGFGVDERQKYGVKRKVDVPVVCVAKSDEDEARYGCHKGKEVVAVAALGNGDTCHGDSGGPGYLVFQGGYKVATATSRSIRENGRYVDCGEGGIYVRLDQYLDWLKAVPGVHW